MPRYSEKSELFSWIKTIVFAVALAVFINSVIIVNAKVPTGSMETTIMTDDRIVALRLSYLFAEPQRGDIVVFEYPDDITGKTLFIKRVIGLPGETVDIRDGRVYIDGSEEPLSEDYVNGTPEEDFGPYEVPADSYFMLGDNRNRSMDSRYWTNTYVNRDKILGKAVFRYLPSPKLIK